jgi:hypothetical protein
VHVRRDRQADEQRDLVRVVIDQIDSHRQALHDFHEISRGVLRRQQRQRRAGPMVKPVMRPLKSLAAAVHVDVQIDGLADAQDRQAAFP